jgi:pyruvate/2-oxoglutarate dehydrogenase complex dihydrolipoamide dehydrogenase (E3) component
MSSAGKFDFDVAVIGGGSGGDAAARTARAGGLSCVVIEGGEEVGGLCILRGCMPTKALLYAGDVIHLARQAGVWGVRLPQVSFNFAEVMARKNAMVREFADFRREQLTGGRFEFRRARATFEDPHTLALSTGKKLTARHFVIATGSVVAPPPLPSLADAGYLTSDTALELRELPKSLIVLGGGAVAVEFAQFFARFDVEVTLIQRSGQLLREFDADAACELERVFRREGIQVFTDTQLTDAGQGRQRKWAAFQHEGQPKKIEAEEILFALGRTPQIAGLGLEQAGVQTLQGRILTNAQMQTTAPHIYAAGDCTGPYEIVHLAVQQGEIAAHNLQHPVAPRSIDYRLLTYVIFTEPQLAIVGLTEKDAAARGLPFLAASHPFSDHGKSLIMEAKDGFVKLLAHAETGEIIGGCCVGPMGGELIHEIVAAMHKRMTVHELAVMPHYHPTLAEIWSYPAEELAERIPLRR